jgi:hypothetical protein
MGKYKYCPKCDADIAESYEPADPSVGIEFSTWHCEECDLVIEDESEDEQVED